jgi:hypothetical protein
VSPRLAELSTGGATASLSTLTPATVLSTLKYSLTA